MTDRKRAAAVRLQRRQREHLLLLATLIAEAQPSIDDVNHQNKKKECSMRGDIADYDWTAQAVAKLRQLWDEAHPASEIGRRLGTSKNAVIGKARRLGLPARPSPIPHGSPAAERAARQKVAARKPPAIMPTGGAAVAKARTSDVLPAATPITATSPEGRAWPARERRECCWPIGEPRTAGFRLCGAPALGRAPYCEGHSQSAYVRAQPERSNGSLKRNIAKQG